MADSNSITLSDYALYSNSPLIQKISYSLLINGMVLADMPLVTYKSKVYNGSRQLFTTGAPTVAFRDLNEDPAVTKAVPKPYQEQAYILSNSIDIDKVLLEDQNQIGDPFGNQLNAYMKAAAYKWNDVFINNTPTADPKAPNGIRYRLDNPTLYDIHSEMKIAAGGSTVDISAGSNGLALLESVQQALDLMGESEGNGVVIYVNATLRRKLDRAVKAAGTTGGFNVSADQFGRSVEYFKGAKLVTIGRKADQSTEIITSTETTAGVDGASNYTSMYMVKYGMEDGLKGWQFHSLEEAITPPFMLQNGVQMRMNIDWPVGIVQDHVRSMARIYGIKVS